MCEGRLPLFSPITSIPTPSPWIYRPSCDTNPAQGGYVRIYPSASQLSIHGTENLSYQVFGHRVWRHSFCKTCGVYIATDPNELSEEEIAALPESVRAFRADKGDKRPFNLRVLNGFDVKSVKPMQVDGWTRQTPGYVNP